MPAVTQQVGYDQKRKSAIWRKLQQHSQYHFPDGAMSLTSHRGQQRTSSTSNPGHVGFKRAENEATTELRRAKRGYETKLAEDIKKGNKSFFRYVRTEKQGGY